MQQRVDAIDWSELESRGLTVYEGIIIASLIEAEAGVDADRPLIASVVVNRLDAPMVLGIDATVIYAIGERGKSLTVSDLDIDSPYNTRKFAGLPPTPIGGPGPGIAASSRIPGRDGLSLLRIDLSNRRAFFYGQLRRVPCVQAASRERRPHSVMAGDMRESWSLVLFGNPVDHSLSPVYPAGSSRRDRISGDLPGRASRRTGLPARLWGAPRGAMAWRQRHHALQTIGLRGSGRSNQ